VWTICSDFDHAITVWNLDAQDAPRPSVRHSVRVWRLSVTGSHVVSASTAGETLAWTLSGVLEADTAARTTAIAQARDQWADEDALDAKLSSVVPLGRPEVGRIRRTRHWVRTPDEAVAIGTTYVGRKTSEAEEPLHRAGEVRIPLLEADGSVHWLVGHSSPVAAIAVTHDGRLAVSSGPGRIVRIWDLRHYRQLHALRGHGGPVWSAAAVPGRPWAVTASEDRTLVLWNLQDGTQLAVFTGDYPMLRCAASNDGRYVVAGDFSGSVHVLRIEETVVR
jgi:WD40 repeat protein